MIAKRNNKKINQLENKEKDQDLLFLEAEMAKAFIASPEELETEENTLGKWLFDDFQPLDEETGIGYFVFLSSVGFTPGVLVKQKNELKGSSMAALFSLIGTEGVIPKIQSAFFKSAFIANSKLMNTYYNRLVEIARPGENSTNVHLWATKKSIRRCCLFTGSI